MSAETPFTQGQLDAINRALASGTRSVSYNGKTLTYNSFDEMLRARDLIRQELGLVSDANASRHVRVLGRKTSIT